MFSRSRSFVFALAAALAFAAPAPAAANRTIAPVVNVSKKRKRELFGSGLARPSFSSLVGKSSLHISVAQVKRFAAKRRSQRRHKRHLRG